jgi:hypothetical protein
MADKKPWEVAAELDEEPIVDETLDETFDRPHPADVAAKETDAVRLPPGGSKSASTARDLSLFGGRFDPVGVGETVLSLGTGIGAEIGRGLLGMAGTAAGMIPGGESPNEKANRWMDVIPEGTAYQPRTMGGQAGVEGAGELVNLGVEGAKFVGSGYAAMAGGAEAQRNFMETENALGEGVFEVTESPLMATIAQILPEVASMGVPAGKVRPRTPMPETPRVSRRVEARREVDPNVPPPDAFNEVQAALQAGDMQRVRDLVNANPAIVGAFEELGIQWTPGMVSDNAALRQVEGGLEAVAETGIKGQHEMARLQLNQKANELIQSVDGAGSRAGVSTDIKARYDEIHQGLVSSESAAWKTLDEKIPSGIEVGAKDLGDWVRNKAVQAGRGDDIDDGLRALTPEDRELFRLTHQKVRRKVKGEDGKDIIVEEWEYTDPKYEALDRFRADIGEGMNGQGPFGNRNSAELDQMYGRVAAVQKRVANEYGYGQDYASANQATIAKKEFETKMRDVLGRDLQYDAIARIDTASRNLLNGRPNKWDELFENLPDDQKSMAAAQALDQVFFTTKKGTELSGGFVANFKKIKESPELRDRFFEHLPTEARTEFMNIGEAATGFFRALEDVNFSRTGNARNVMDAMKQPGWMNRIIGGTAEVGVGWMPVLGQLIRNVRRSGPDARTAAEAGRLRATADLLRDPALRRSIIEYANGNVQRANEILQNSKSWLAWQKTQPIPFQRELQSAGIVALFEETEE